MPKLDRVISLCLVLASSLCAQQSQPKLTAADLQQWLRSGDPRQIVWAAHYVAQYGEAAYPGTHTIMVELLDKERTSTEPNALAPAASQHDHNEAVAALLDAFILQKAPPSTGIIATVADTFPNQAILLASYLPQAEKSSLLESWYGLRNYNASGRLLARFATLMLADHPPPALAANLVNEAEEHLTIVLQQTPEPGSGVGGAACGDFLSTPVRPNWPVVYTYQLEENATGTRDPLLVAVDDDRITYRRVADNEPEGSCFGVRWLNPRTRHSLIAHWLGIPERSMSWSTQSVAMVVWTTREAYLAELARSIEQHRQALQATVQALVARHILQNQQAISVQPQLVLSFACEIDPCPLGGGETRPPAVDPLGVN